MEANGKALLRVIINKLEAMVQLLPNHTDGDINCLIDGVTFKLQKNSPLINHINANSLMDATTIKKTSVLQNSNKNQLSISKTPKYVPSLHKCNFCGNCYSSRGCLWRHGLEKHEGEKFFECVKCQESFVNRSEYFAHVEEHKKSIVKIFKCPQCFKKYSKLNLKRHMVIHTNERPYKCNQFPKTFPYETSLRMHVQRHSKISFGCSFCDRSFLQKAYLHFHITTVHAGEKHWICKECGKYFANPHKLRTHSELVHGIIRRKVKVKPKLFKCNFCISEFSRPDELEKHIYTHTGEKPYKCEVCNLDFNQKSALNRHKRIHTGGKPFKCNFCNVSFALKTTLQIHIRTHTGEQQKNQNCKTCGKMFETKYQLKVHTRIHDRDKPFQCGFCPKSFIQNSNLNTHIIRVHTKEKNVKCPCCGKGFYRNKDMELHKKTHTGDRDYSCTRCDKSYITLRSLQRHELEKHEKLNE